MKAQNPKLARHGGQEIPNESKTRNPKSRIAIARLIASGAGIGFMPLFPGTIASIVAAGVYAAVVLLTSTWWIPVPLTIAAGVVGVWLGNHARELLGKDDPPAFVLDEIVGMWLAMFGMGDALPLTWYGVLAALVLFRLFDIVKPYPASRLNEICSGWGIMGDDVAAGLYAGIVVRIGWIGIAIVAR